MAADGADRPGAEDPLAVLRRLEERLDVASAAAERLLGDAAREGSARESTTREGAAQDVPRMGWQAAGADGAAGAGGASSGDADLLLALLATVRDRIPPDLQRRLTEALREVLLALRALIDWYLQRTERPAPPDGGIEDIPIL